ncbi:lysophospholipase [Streptomyces phaeochromogenes]|uniref:alpha/beta hydrolase n=1 Tax=Streptomyces phaeochromogenes TaxID=1923 RepID=UPI00386F0863|nr:lysophospholipase [Streptomyces phaeochromogenes]
MEAPPAASPQAQGAAAPSSSKSASKPAESPADEPVAPQRPASYKPAVPRLTARTATGQLVNKCVPKRLWNSVRTLTTKDRKHLSTLIPGKGTNAVYFGHQYGGQVCNFLDLAEQMAARGYRVILPEFRGHVASEAAGASSPLDMRAAFHELKTLHARHVFLAGESCGGTTAVVEGVRSGIPIVGLLLLSSPARCDGDAVSAVSAVSAVRTIEQPSLFMVTHEDMQGRHEKQLREVYDASPATQKHFVVVDGEAHGTLMLYGDDAADARRTKVVDFMTHTYAAALRK